MSFLSWLVRFAWDERDQLGGFKVSTIIIIIIIIIINLKIPQSGPKNQL